MLIIYYKFKEIGSQLVLPCHNGIKDIAVIMGVLQIVQLMEVQYHFLVSPRIQKGEALKFNITLAVGLNFLFIYLFIL